MGLDIYFYRVSSKEKAEEFLAASKQYEIAYDAYTEKYKEPIEKAASASKDTARMALPALVWLTI